MAYTAETVNARIRNLRGDAVTAARVLLTHLDRAEKSRDLLATALDDLGMFASNRKAEVTDAEKTFERRGRGRGRLRHDRGRGARRASAPGPEGQGRAAGMTHPRPTARPLFPGAGPSSYRRQRQR
jgi:hypothetical protein